MTTTRLKMFRSYYINDERIPPIETLHLKFMRNEIY